MFGKQTPTASSSTLLEQVQGFLAKNERENGRKPEPELQNSTSSMPELSHKQRIFGFITCLSLSFFCFFLSTFYIPVLVLRARKFVALFTLGSLFFIGSFAALRGPWEHLKRHLGPETWLCSTAYLFSLGFTIYTSMSLQSTVLTIFAAVLQIICLGWYWASFVPGGRFGIQFISKVSTVLFKRAANSVMPV